MIKDEIEHICVNKTSRSAANLPSKSIMLSDIWRFDSLDNVHIGLEADIPIKGPEEIGEELWNNYTISVYSSDCALNRRYWSQQSFTTLKKPDGSRNIQFIVRSDGGRCQVRTKNDSSSVLTDFSASGADGIRKRRLPAEFFERDHCSNLLNLRRSLHHPMHLLDHHFPALLQDEKAGRAKSARSENRRGNDGLYSYADDTRVVASIFLFFLSIINC